MKYLIFFLFLFFIACETNSNEGKNCTSTLDCETAEACLFNKCIDEMELCKGIKCENGSCKVEAKKPICECNFGYELDKTDEFKCVESPCSKNSECKDDFVCINKECVDQIILCEGENCSNNGECVAENKAVSCNCNDGFISKGMQCLVDKCKDVECPSFKICNVETGECERYTDPCENVDCGDHGECEFDEDKNPHCKCEKGYVDQDLKCIFEIACTPNPNGEICGDGIDNNCNFIAEEECSCSNGDTLECYTGAVNTEGVGECKKGAMSCPSGEFWTECVGEVIPEEEICDNKDNDCNGTIDKTPAGETLFKKCYTGNEAELSVTNGRCKAGKQICTNGTFDGVVCADEILPIEELCGNSIDDDCDGDIDEDCVAPIVVCSQDINKVYIFENPVRVSATATDTNGEVISTNWKFLSKPDGTASELSPITGDNTSFLPDTVGEYIVRFSATDNDDETSYCDIKIGADTRDNLNVHLSWNNSADADLYLLGPAGGDWTTNSCNWGVVNPHWYDDSKKNPHLDRDDMDGYGPEVIQIERPNDGRYTVGVNLFDQGVQNSTEVTIKIKCQDEDFIFTKTLNSSGDWWFVKDIVWLNDGCTVEDATRN